MLPQETAHRDAHSVLQRSATSKMHRVWYAGCLHEKSALLAEPSRALRSLVPRSIPAYVRHQIRAERCPDTSSADSPHVAQIRRGESGTTPGVPARRDGLVNTGTPNLERFPCRGFSPRTINVGNRPMFQVAG